MKIREVISEDIADLGTAYQQYIQKPLAALVQPAAASATPPPIPTSLPAKIQDKNQPAGQLKIPKITAKPEPAPFSPSANKDLLIKVAKKMGITNTNDLANLLGQVAVETANWASATENFNYTDPMRIHKVFTSNFPSPQHAAPYVGNPVALANKALANKNGNGDETSGDGWNFRGRGFIHLTGRELYAAAGAALHPQNPGIFLQNPTLLSSNPTESAKAAVWYFLHKVGKGKSAKHATNKVNPAGLKSSERTKATLAAKQNLTKLAAVAPKKTRKS
jgi:putative chitinase